MKENQAEIIAVGSELLLGRIVDTNTSYLASKLSEIGIEVIFQTMVGDDRKRMRSVLRQALKRSSIIITSGGIGPTEDDLTREVISEVTGKKLIFHPRLFALIKSFFDQAGFMMAPNNRKQALIPAGARPIPNLQGTAPGFILKTEPGPIIAALPGVPRELKRMFVDTVQPFLSQALGRKRGLIETKVLKLCGLGESRVDEQIGDLIRSSKNPVIGLLSSPGEIRISLTARGKDPQETSSLIAAMEAQIRQRLGSLIFGEGEETLEGVVAGLLEQKGIHLGLVETLTAGRISQRLQNRRTRFFKGGWVIPQEGARPLDSSRLSGEEKALTQAREIRSFLESDWGLAVLVEEVEGRQVLYLGLAGTKEESYSHKIGGFSDTLPDRVAVMALDWLRKKLTKEM